MQTTRTPYSVSFMATVLLLLLFACHSTIANAAVALGATRVIYPANQKQVLLPVTNNDPASVYLIQSWIENAGDQKDTQFVITPPLFSMQGKKENTLRIINATNHQLPGDRESLFWVNVKAIPAMEKDQKNENTLQLAIISRIKMFYRPTHLAMAPEEAPAMLRFRRSGSKLTLINPTPYFITVTNMKAGNSNLPNTMVPPKGEVSVDIPHAVTGDISFQTINETARNIRQKNMCRTTAHAHHFRIVWLTHHLSLMLVSNICHSPFRKYMSAEWLAAMFLLICGKKE